MKSAGKIEQKNDKGMMVPLVLALIFLLAMIVWPLNNYMRHERNLVARMRYSAITDKMAISAVNEACAWFNCCVLNLNALLDAPVSSLSRAEKSVLAPVIETDIEGLRGVLGEKELHSFDIIKESGGRLNSVEFYYSGFKNYFKDTPSSDYENSCYIPADPFERTGGLMISASVSYRGITRVFTTRYEIKITNTLPPVVSAFTFFTKSRNPLSSENSLVMEGASSPSRWHLGPQGIIYENASASSFLAVPLIMVHHPDDIAVIDGYCPNHEKIREYLPPDPSVTPATANFYRPSMDGRGWVYFGAEPTQAYVFNLSPGNANPQAVKPYPDTQKHKFYGNGFLMLESDLIAPVNSSLKGCYPFSHSFTAVNTPSGISDYVIRIINSGIYWIARSKNFPLKSYMLGNYYALRPKTNDFSSVLQISGDLQPVMFMGTGKPSRYLDRRSPTIVFGKAFRSFLQIGSVAQNCVHLPGSKGFDFMNAGLHKYPFEACPDGPHPKTVNLPYFEINRNSGLLGTNAYMPFTHPAWHEHRIVDDFNGTTAVGVGGIR